ncbi:ABC transporter substrate-binding protein [Candidatus Amesbacteria bacterium]|nr:ABC transporter substrate-binding protein [Candidatus Amesbacteria bacterium]
MFRILRFHLRLVVAFVNKYRGVILAGIIMGVVTFWLIPKVLKILPKFGSTNKIAIVGRYSLSDIPLSIQQEISFGLTTISEKQEILPGIAKSWSVSEDGKIYIFNLRDDLFWHDGTRLKSRDINYSFKDATIDYPNDSTLTITLSEAYAALPAQLSRPAFKFGLIGLGGNRVIKIKKNGLYLEELKLSNGTIYRFYVSQNLAKIAYKLGEVDILTDQIPGDELEKWPNTETIPTIRYDRYIVLLFNTPSIDKSSRQSLAYAVDKKRWSPRSYGPISPKSWAYNQDVKFYEYDPTKAVAVKKLSQITISTLPAFLKDAELVKSDWEKFGIKVQIIVGDVIPESFETLLIAQAIPIDPDQYHLWHSTQITNITRLDNKRIDKILEDGRKTSDQAKRLLLYKDFQKYLLEDMPTIFLYYQTTNTLIRK